MLTLLRRRKGMLGMDGIRGCDKDPIDIRSFQDILKTLFLIATVLLAEGRAFLRGS